MTADAPEIEMAYPRRRYTKEEAQAAFDYRQRIMAMGENLLTRMPPEHVSEASAAQCYRSAREFYLQMDAELRQIAEIIGLEAASAER